jgi:hypothetical protein
MVITGFMVVVVSLVFAWLSYASWAPKSEPKFWSEVCLQMSDQETAF